MTYESRKPTEARFIIRWYSDDRDDPEAGGEWRVIDSNAQRGRQVVASYGVGSDDQSETQRTAAVLHARSLNG
jgi:hypothetical protein